MFQQKKLIGDLNTDFQNILSHMFTTCSARSRCFDFCTLLCEFRMLASSMASIAPLALSKGSRPVSSIFKSVLAFELFVSLPSPWEVRAMPAQGNWRLLGGVCALVFCKNVGPSIVKIVSNKSHKKYPGCAEKTYFVFRWLLASSTSTSLQRPQRAWQSHPSWWPYQLRKWYLYFTYFNTCLTSQHTRLSIIQDTFGVLKRARFGNGT